MYYYRCNVPETDCSTNFVFLAIHELCIINDVQILQCTIGLHSMHGLGWVILHVAYYGLNWVGSVYWRVTLGWDLYAGNPCLTDDLLLQYKISVR